MIIKVTYENQVFYPLIGQFINMLNRFYEQNGRAAYLEQIENGFLYIIQDFPTFIEMSLNSQKVIQKCSKNDQYREKLKIILIEKYGFNSQDSISFCFEQISDYNPNLMKYFELSLHTINSNYIFIPIEEKTFILEMPDLDSFIDYLAVISEV